MNECRILGCPGFCIFHSIFFIRFGPTKNATMGKPHATLSPLDHRGATHIKVAIANNEQCKNLIRQVQGRKWSKTHGCWYVPYSKEAFRQLKELFEVTLPPAFSKHLKSPDPTDQTTIKTEVPTTHSIRIERENEYRAKAFVPWDRKDWIEKIRTIPGRAWNEGEKYWSLPLTKTTFINLTNWFGEHLQTGFAVPDNLPETYLPKGWKQSPASIVIDQSSRQLTPSSVKKDPPTHPNHCLLRRSTNSTSNPMPSPIW